MAAVGDGGKQQIFVRSLDALTVQPIQGTERAIYPFWSPAGDYIGFFTPEKLKKVALSSGAVPTICDATDGRGATWSKNGVIVFSGMPGCSTAKFDHHHCS